jgi:hypothetical protein
MATEQDGKPQGSPHREDGYEKRDASSKWLFGLIGILAVCIAVAEVVLRLVHTRMEKTPAPTDGWSSARPQVNPGWTQANIPRLQVSAPEDLSKFHLREEAELNSYGWINRTSGVVRIPIAHAMDLLAERGLPVRKAVGQSRLGPTPLELQQQRTNSTQAETVIAR